MVYIFSNGTVFLIEKCGCQVATNYPVVLKNKSMVLANCRHGNRRLDRFDDINGIRQILLRQSLSQEDEYEDS